MNTVGAAEVQHVQMELDLESEMFKSRLKRSKLYADVHNRWGLE